MATGSGQGRSGTCRVTEYANTVAVRGEGNPLARTSLYRSRSVDRGFRLRPRRQRRGSRPQALQRPHQGARNHRLQARRPFRQRRPRPVEPLPPRLAAEQADQDGPEAVRHPVGGLPQGRRHAADQRCLRLSRPRDQRHAAPPLVRRGARTASTPRARRWTSISPACRSPSSAPSGCRPRPAASATIRAPARPSSTWIPAPSATGRA